MSDKEPQEIMELILTPVEARASRAERFRIRKLALAEAEKNRVPGSEGSGDCREALRWFATLLEDR